MIAKWRDQWTAEAGADWAIAQRTDDKAIRRVWLRFIDLRDGEAEVAYWVAPQGRGRGTASHAVSILSSWLLDDLGLHRLQLGHSVQNHVSCRVATNAGLKLEGTSKSALLHADGCTTCIGTRRQSTDSVRFGEPTSTGSDWRIKPFVRDAPRVIEWWLCPRNHTGEPPKERGRW
jgi:RimJ/RimL family protein N-acetyltransferase